VNRTFSREGSVAASTVDTRIELWSMALAVIRDAPLTGVGMNGFRRIGPERYPTLLLPPGADAVHAHNNLLQAALDLGLPGLAAYVATWAIAGWLLVTVYRRSSDAVYRALAGGLTAGLIAHFTFGIGDAIPLGAKVGVLFWLTLALVEGLYQVTDARPAGIPAPSQNPAATSGA
jgi:putative inorganic carbon (HCO3(-)) transporter